MYNCALEFYFAACSPNFVEIITAVQPLERFAHRFYKSSRIDMDAVSRCDVIFLGPTLDCGEISAIIATKKLGAEVILLREGECVLPPAILDRLEDVWRLPLDDNMIRFHFGRLQKQFKEKKDAQLTSQYLECFLDTTPNMAWVKDKNGVHELVNASFCRTVRKTREQVTGKRHAYIWNVEKDDPACIETERIVMETGATHVAEEEIATDSGKRLLKTYKSPIYDDDGAIMGVLGIAVDITRERAYHERLMNNTAAMETLYTSMDCGILCQPLDGSHVLSVNMTALRLLGYDSLESLDAGFKVVADSVLDEDKPRLRKAIASLKEIGDSANYEYRIKHNDGKIIHVMGNARLIEKDGKLVVQRFLLDCTMQKMAEEKVKREKERKQEELVRALCVDYQLVCVFGTPSSRGTILQLKDGPDSKLNEIFSSKRSLRQKFEKYIQTCVYPEDRETCGHVFSLDVLREKLARKDIYYFNYRALNGEGVHYFQLKAVRAGGGGNSFGIVIGLQSVDARARYELEQKNRLAEALKEAKKASNAKTIFLSNMSHDIRTPMNAIAGYTSLALNRLDRADSVTGYLTKIRDSSQHLISLVNDILDMSHIESGKIQLEEKLWDLPGILRELWNIVQPTADAKNQKLTLDMQGVRDDLIYCDKLRLNQVLLNILSNAVKYTQEGGAISMMVRQTSSTSHDNSTYEFRIKDNGIGMSEDFIERIFEPFERARNSTMAGIEGTGLGMTIARNLVNMMNGHIGIRSALGVGSEFTLTVSFRVESESMLSASQGGSIPGPENCVSSSQNGGLAQPRTSNGYRLLLAEDNAMNQEIACEFLTSAGYAVDVAQNGREAVDMLMSAGPGYYQAVLMDVQMPVMGGYMATSLIRALPDKELANLPIIAMTANSFEEDRKEAMDCGMNCHIAKPVDFNILFTTLDELLAKPVADADSL